VPASAKDVYSSGPDVASLDLGKIKCERRLGGLLKHYYRDAA